MSSITIVTDIAPYRADWERLYAAYAAFYKVEQTPDMRARVWTWIEEGRILCLMALDTGGRPIGFAHVREFVRPLMAVLGGYLDDLFVDPEQRGAGVVDFLFDAIKAKGRERGWSLVRWITREDNYRARAVYDRLATRTNWTTYDLTL